MLETLTGSGLAVAAGLNAYIPLLTAGLLARYTDWITLPAGWSWLTNGWMLAILGVLLVVEIVADKVPAVDHVNDVLATVIRPTSGGLVFGATASAPTVAVSDPQAFADTNWVPILVGATVALSVHLLKVATRAVLNSVTFGIAAPVVSTIEDTGSVTVSVLAIIAPIVILAVFAILGFVAWRVWRRWRRRRNTSGGPRPRLWSLSRGASQSG